MPPSPHSPPRPMQVTIALLPVSLSLVHIPRSRLHALSHPVLRQILQPNPTFLNITCNEIELSLFAEDHVLLDFEPIARRDRQRQRSRSGSGFSRKNTSHNDIEPLEISYEKWSVLQIDSHSDQLDNSGARVNELSAPLAAAGISILYQSSYMSDFIFVKESRLQEAMNLFASSGFDLYSSDSSLFSNPAISPSLSPTSDEYSPAVDITASVTTTGTVLTRSRSSTDTSLSSVPPQFAMSSLKEQIPTPSSETPNAGQSSPRQKSHSPTAGEVRMLNPDLTCVGLSDELGVDHWGLKIIKLVAYPDLIPPSKPCNAPSQARTVLLNSLSPRGRSAADSESSSSSSEEDDGYFSHSPQNMSTSSLMTSASRSYTNLASPSSSHFRPPSKHLVSTVSPLSPIRPSHPSSGLSILTDSAAYRAHAPPIEPRVPFFSFTRTPEGSSLTADVHLLATLFPPHERHMVICSGELDAADERLNGGEEESDEEYDSDDSLSQGSTLKCLQIDLRRFGLDKYGLVNRFSRVLEDSGINHMYSSTFKTANLLVDKKHAVRAQSLLRAC
ncbi:hypothetical protein BDQ12DRAFT_718943 [Crucibulum laeve]|uniref:CASTOR ACT domain-containing protein n=1 Tax=Crucibulum laeve TaxID=68775 RepID=A0A5C3MEI0_9AGAR|nr:hypothetical protein BDQ12DRAFT_718943 [Crucibulum laeve]